MFLQLNVPSHPLHPEISGKSALSHCVPHHRCLSNALVSLSLFLNCFRRYLSRITNSASVPSPTDRKPPTDRETSFSVLVHSSASSTPLYSVSNEGMRTTTTWFSPRDMCSRILDLNHKRVFSSHSAASRHALECRSRKAAVQTSGERLRDFHLVAASDAGCI